MPNKGTFGFVDVWTWTAIEASSKLIVSYIIGLRDGGYATEFMRDVASRTTNRMQLATDGLKAYLDAFEDAFAGEVDYTQLDRNLWLRSPATALPNYRMRTP